MSAAWRRKRDGASDNCVHANLEDVDTLRRVLEGEEVLDEWKNAGVVTAARRNLLDALEILLGNGADSCSRDAAGDTPALVLACAGEAGVVETLLKAGADVHAVGRTGDSALLKFFSRPRAGDAAGVLRLLLEAGADPYQPNARGETALDRAALRGQAGLWPELARAARQCDGWLSRPVRGKEALLHRLMRVGNEAAVCAVLAEAEDVDLAALRDEAGRNPLHVAGDMQLEHPDAPAAAVDPRLGAMRALVAHCPRLLHEKDDSGREPLETCVACSTPEFVAAMLDAGAELSPGAMRAAVESRRFGSISVLFSRGADCAADALVSLRWRHGANLAHMAARSEGYGLPLLTALTEAKPAVLAALCATPSDDGRLPLHTAMAEGAPASVVGLLVPEDGALAADLVGSTPLSLALDRADASALAALARAHSGKYRAAVLSARLASVRTTLGESLLHRAVRAADPDAIAFCVNDAAIPVDTPVPSDCIDAFFLGGTPLHYAADADDLSLAELIVSLGASLHDTSDALHLTPAQRASTRGHRETANSLFSLDPTQPQIEEDS